MKKLWLDIQIFVYTSLLRIMSVEKYWQYRAQEIQAKSGLRIHEYKKLNWKRLREIVLMMELIDIDEVLFIETIDTQRKDKAGSLFR